MFLLAWKLAKNTYLGKIDLNKEFIVEFSIKPLGTRSDWTNILRLTSTGKGCCGVGDRIPGVWFHSQSTKLYVCFAIDGNGDRCFDTQQLPMNKFSKILIQQIKNKAGKFIYTIKVDDKVVEVVENKKQ